MSEWEYFYLKLWKEDTTKCDVASKVILGKLGVQEVPLLQSYFAPFGGRASISLFLEFILIFTFLKPDQLLPLIYSIIQVKSNRFITEEQVFVLMHYLKTTPDGYQRIGEWLSEIKKNENGFIPLNELSTFLLNEISLLYILSDVKAKIIEMIITFEVYESIERKMIYYDESSGVIKDPPSESCFSSLMRSMFSPSPPPYYCSYKYIKKVNVEDILFAIRQRFGYSTRPTNCESSYMAHSTYSTNSLKVQKSVFSHETASSNKSTTKPLTVKRSANYIEISNVYKVSTNKIFQDNSKVVPVV